MVKDDPSQSEEQAPSIHSQINVYLLQDLLHLANLSLAIQSLD